MSPVGIGRRALLSAVFRASLFCAIVLPRGGDSTRALWIEILFRIALGGCWGSLMQVFRRVRPAWLAALTVTIALPSLAQALECAVLRLGRAPHVGTAVILSTVVSLGSLAVNFYLMRRGLLITGRGAASLTNDVRRLPTVLADCFSTAAMSVRRILRENT